MNLSLSPGLQERVAEQVRSGRFPTPQAVIEAAVAGLPATEIDDTLNDSDIAAINEAEAQIDRGEGIDLQTLRSEMAKRFRTP